MVKRLLLVLGVILSISAYANEWLSYTITVNKHKIHYYESGKGSPVFLLSGYATTSNFWDRDFVTCLAKDHTVYLVDYWGVNTNDDVDGNDSIQAMAEDAFGLTESLKVKHPVFIGWSMGGAVAQQIAFSYPDDIKQVVLISPLTVHNQPTTNNAKPPVSFNSYDSVLNYVFDNNLYDYTQAKLNKYKNSLFSPTDKLFTSGKVSQNERIAMNEWTSDDNTLSSMLQSEANYLFLIPRQDKMLVPEQTEADARVFKRVKMVEFEGSGHNIAMQAPYLACQQINKFL